MRLPKNWLEEYVELNISDEEYVKRMIALGFESDGIETLYDSISGVVVGRIRSIEKHPDADRLLVCQLDVGQAAHVQVVTGAQNVCEGALVPVALAGACLQGGLKIKKGKLRGVESLGMLCSGAELGLKDGDYPGAEVDGIMILCEEYPLGQDIRQALHLTDTVYEFEITANRPDCMSILGLARETAIALGKEMKAPALPERIEGSGDVQTYAGVEVIDTDLCPRYMAGLAVNLRIGPSPEWMRRRLHAAGVRPINNIVDITNYVMLEYGQPMHAFDYDFLNRGRIIVRRAREGEQLTTLDGKEHTLTSDMLAIADSSRVIGLAGVMGGLNSEITQNTKAVLFESALFYAPSIRKTSKRLGIMTESSQRFSKGLDICRPELALKRALQLVRELDAGDVVGGCIDVLSESTEPRVVQTEAARVNKLLGLELSPQQMVDAIRTTGIVATHENGVLTCELPVFRMDIEGDADIAEEIGRIYGYDNIPMTMMGSSETMRGRLSDTQRMTRRLKELLCACGAYEAVTYSFMGSALLDALLLAEEDERRDCVSIMNPFGEDQRLMRSTMVPAMLKVVQTNINMKTTKARFFETGRIFFKKEEAALPQEDQMLCISAFGAEEDFFTIKGMVECLLQEFGIGACFSAEDMRAHPYYHAGKRARIALQDGSTLGIMGEIDMKAAANYGIEQRVSMAEINLDTLFAYANTKRTFAPLPKYPGVERDLAVIVEKGVSHAQVLKSIQRAGGKLLVSVRLFDVYEGAQVGADHKSLAYSLLFRSDEKTLTDQDVAAPMEKILASLQQDCAARLRA